MPLSGIKVVEIGQNIAGPYAATILADLGAEVVKVEKPEGDDARGWIVRAPDGRDVPVAFAMLNHGKKSVVVDFKDPAQMARFKRYLKDVDVLVHNLRPGLAEELGLGAEELTALNPRLVYCEVGAFGHKGPLRRKPGYEPLGHAYSGIMALNGEPDGPPLRAGVSIIDPGTGMWAAIGIMAALRKRDRTGKGAVVNASLLETGLVWTAHPTANYLLTGKEPARQGNGNPILVPYEVFRTATQPMMIAAGNNRLYARLCAELGRPELATDPRFATVPDRLRHKDELIPMVQAILETKPQAHWRERLDALGIPNAPINKVSEVVVDPQVEALDIIQTDPGTGARMYGLAVSIDGVRPPFRAGAPGLGEHTDEVLGPLDE